MLLRIDAAALGEALRWEPSRGGELFPHLYGAAGRARWSKRRRRSRSARTGRPSSASSCRERRTTWRPWPCAPSTRRTRTASPSARSSSGLGPRAAADDPALPTTLAGLALPNPVGLAPGFDKNAEASAAMLAAGFGFVECGTVTPRPQAGNPRPRLFRLTEDRAVINRMGFNNVGVEALRRQPGAAAPRRGGRQHRGQQGRRRPHRRLCDRRSRGSGDWRTTSPSTSPRRTRRACGRCRPATRWPSSWAGSPRRARR